MGFFDTLAYYALIGWLLKQVVAYASTFVRIDVRRKAVLVTGCDSGFGRAIALRLHAAGAHVLAACLTETGARDLTAAAQAQGGNGQLDTLLLDVTKDASVAAMGARVRELLGADGALHAVINNAGVLRGGLFDSMTMEDWELQMQVNVLGIARVTKAVVPLLLKAGGRVVNVSSVAGIFATDATVAYNAAKFAVTGLTDAMRREFRDWGIKVICIHPGIMKTPLWDQPLDKEAPKRMFDALDDDQKAFYGSEKFFENAVQEARDLVFMVAGDPKLVVDTMEQAVCCRFPFRKYYPGYDTWAFRFLALVPDIVGDFLWGNRNIALGKEKLIPPGVLKQKVN